MKLTQIPPIAVQSTEYWHSKSSNSSWHKGEKWEIRALEYAIAETQKAYEAAKEIYAKNIPIIEENKVYRERIEALMAVVGIPAGKYVSYYKTSRSRNMTTEYRESGYRSDMDEYLPITQSDRILSKYEDVLKVYNERLNKAKQDIEKRNIAKEAAKLNEERNRRMYVDLCRLSEKYGLDPLDCNFGDIQDAILSKCKYLNLAVAMEAARGDFSLGSHVEDHLFDPETEQDREIIDSVRGACERFYSDQDGRHFRDCKWCYGAIYELVDVELLEDYELVRTYL